MLRDRAAVLRFGLAVVPAALRALPERLALAALFARDALAFAVPLLLLDLRAVPDRDLAPDELLRVPELREEADEPEPELEPELVLDPSSLHLPDITRCAASATASAISEPSLVALDIMLLAAWLAVSAASRPASRIARRAFGLALIAAAAAANPAASISLLIAALASLSTVLSLLFEVEPDEPEELLRADLAIASSPSVCAERHFKPVTVPKPKRKSSECGASLQRAVPAGETCKGHRRAIAAMPFDMVSGRK